MIRTVITSLLSLIALALALWMAFVVGTFLFLAALIVLPLALWYFRRKARDIVERGGEHMPPSATIIEAEYEVTRSEKENGS